MRADGAGLALRLALAWLLLSIVVLFLYLVGAAQNFLESTQAQLFRVGRWLTWGGFLGSWLLLLPAVRRKGTRIAAALALGVGFTLLFAFVVVWGSWIYPDSGNLPW